MGWYLVLLLVAKAESSFVVSLRILLLVCSDVLTETEVSLKQRFYHNDGNVDPSLSYGINVT